MNTNIIIRENKGIVSTGDGTINGDPKSAKTCQKVDDIKWEFLDEEIYALKSSSDLSIKKFADEVGKAAEKKDRQGIRAVLSKWIPCIADLISSSYYILEIAKNFRIGE